MENSPHHRHGHHPIRVARYHARRQLLSRPEIQVTPIEPSRPISNVFAAPVGARPPTTLVPPAETRPAPSPPLLVPPPVTPPTNTVPVLPDLVTPTPVVRIAPQATLTPVISSKTTPPLPSCSAGGACAPLAPKSAALTSLVPQQTPGPQQFFASLSSSPGAIFFTCLAGIAVVGVMLAILSCVLRSWCNRRRRSSIDEDAWRPLENSKDFFVPSQDDVDELSVKSSHFRSDSQSSLAHLQPTLAKKYVAPHPFPSHMQQQTQQAVARYHFAGFPIQDEHHMNGLIAEEGLKLGWVAPPVPVSSKYNGVWFTPCGPPAESMESCQRGCTVPELVFRKTSIAASFCNRASMHASPTQAPASTFTRPASVITRSGTNATTSHQQKMHHQLTREASLACSVQSTAVEELRERVADQQKDLRATIRGAIQTDKKANDDRLESLTSLWHDKNAESQKDFLRRGESQTSS